jgi:hypothetical protein
MQIRFSLRRLKLNPPRFGPMVLAGCVAWFVPALGALAAEATIELSPLVAKSTLLAPLDSNKEIGVVLALPSSNPKGVAEYIEHISGKGDPLYHHYLTPQQFAERFGGAAGDYAALKQWATNNGLKISQESVGRLNLTVRGSVSQLQKIFSTQINSYRAPDGSEFYSASIKPTVPSAIASKISGVIGLTDGKQSAPLYKIAKRLGESPVSVSSGSNNSKTAGSGPGGTYSAKDLRIAYSIPTFGNLSDNSVVAVFEQGGFAASDVTEYLDTNDLPHVKVTPVSVDNSPTTVSDPNVELEAVLDIDMIIGINPSVDEVRVYEDSIDTFQTALLDAITQVGDENKAQVLSISYGQDEGYQGSDAMKAENAVLQQLATEGITVTASSGDLGAYGDGYNSPYNVSDPASQPYVTGVGGTSLYTGVGRAYVDEQAWNELASGLGATGGGISSYWAIPPYQSNEPAGYMTFNGGSSTMRNVPDVAAVGDPLTGVGVYSKINGGWIMIGGTSASSPIWAGYLSIINAAFNYTGLKNLGFCNPALYAVGTPEYGFGNPAHFLYDITVGSNGNTALSGFPGYSNGPGYSNTTGNGSLWGSGFATQLMISGTASGTGPGAIVGFRQVRTTDTTVTLGWTAAKGASGYVVGVYTMGNYGWTVVQSFITKDATITIPDLVHGQDYWAYIWAFNGSGGSQAAGPFNVVPGSLYGGSGVDERVLTSPNPNVATGPEFGWALALDGKTLLAGAPFQDINNRIYLGAAYVYVEPPQGWGSDKPINAAELTASDGKVGQQLGEGVAISADTIALSANYKDYVYVKPAGGWTTATENARLLPPSGYEMNNLAGIAVDGDTIVAACAGKVTPFPYAGAIYIKPVGGWSGDIKPVAVLTDGQSGDGFGRIIAISGDTIAVSAWAAEVGGFPEAGAVHVYEKPADGWKTTSTPTATLIASDAHQYTYLGTGLGLSGDTIVAGAPSAVVKGVLNWGAAYVFVRKGAHWHSETQTAILTIPSNPKYPLSLGQSAAIHGDMIVVGGPSANIPDGSVNGGELFYYRKPSGGWRNTSKYDGVLYNPNALDFDELGISVAIQNGTIIGGQHESDDVSTGQAGSVDIFRVH